MQTTTAAATLAAAQTVNAAAVRALRHAAVAVAVLVVGVSLPTAALVADLDAAAASTACVAMGALVVVGALVVGVSSLLDDLRATAAESHLRSARLADREHALKVAEAQARVAVEQTADLRAAHEAAVGGVCDGINEARALTAERDAARAEVATLTADLDAAHDALAEAEARVRDHAATDAALAQVQADAERAEARAVEAERALGDHSEVVKSREFWREYCVSLETRAVEAEAEVERLRSDLSAVRVTMAEQVVAAQVERDAATERATEAERKHANARDAALAAMREVLDGDAERDRLRDALREAHLDGLAWRHALRDALPRHPMIVAAEEREEAARAEAQALAEREAERAADSWAEHYSGADDDTIKQ